MKFRDCFKIIAMAVLAGALFGCGGGGSSNGPAGVTVSGVASKGIFFPGTVRVYALNADGTEGALLKETSTDAKGAYSANIGSHSGPVLVKVFGTYADEATGKPVIVPETKPLKAALPEADVIGKSAVTVAVTPLSDIAVRKAQENGGNLADNIAGANQKISQLFGVNITTVLPVKPDATTLQDKATTDDQKKYTTALATLSQYVANSRSDSTADPSVDDLQNALSQISSGISTTGAPQVTAPQIAYNLQQAASTLSTNTNTKSIVDNSGTSGQSTLNSFKSLGNSEGSKIIGVRLKTAGSPNVVYGVTATVAIPTGATLRAKSDHTPESGVLVASGQASGVYVNGKVVSSQITIGLAKATGFGVGEFATLYFDVPSSSTLTAVDFVTTLTKISDTKGADIKSGFTVTAEMI